MYIGPVAELRLREGKIPVEEDLAKVLESPNRIKEFAVYHKKNVV